MPQTDDYVERLVNLGQTEMARVLLKDRLRRSTDYAHSVFSRAEPNLQLLDAPIVEEYHEISDRLLQFLRKLTTPAD